MARVVRKVLVSLKVPACVAAKRSIATTSPKGSSKSRQVVVRSATPRRVWYDPRVRRDAANPFDRTPPPPLRDAASMNPRDRLLKRRKLIVVTGKGGVGKSAMTSVLGHSLARRGRRTLVLEVDPRENLHQLLGVPPSGGEIVTGRRRTSTCRTSSRTRSRTGWWSGSCASRCWRARCSKSPIYHRFVEGRAGPHRDRDPGSCPTVGVAASFGHAPDDRHRGARRPGHRSWRLSADRSEALCRGDHARGLSLAWRGRSPSTSPTAEAASGLVVVTLAEEMPVQEALELRRALAEEVRPRAGAADRQRPLPASSPPAPRTTESWPRCGAVAAASTSASSHVSSDCWQGPRIELPLLPIDGGAELMAKLTRGALRCWRWSALEDGGMDR